MSKIFRELTRVQSPVLTIVTSALIVSVPSVVKSLAIVQVKVQDASPLGKAWRLAVLTKTPSVKSAAVIPVPFSSALTALPFG